MQICPFDVLMHAQHEGVLTYGDIRFGPIKQKKLVKDHLLEDLRYLLERMQPTTFNHQTIVIYWFEKKSGTH